MSSDRIEKIRALLDSPQEGEREAAAAALARLDAVEAEPTTPPRPGTAEWHEARQRHWEKVCFLVSNMRHPSLTKEDRVLIRNAERYRGGPWKEGGKKIEIIYDKVVKSQLSIK